MVKCIAAQELAKLRKGIKEQPSERKVAAARANLVKARRAKLALLALEKSVKLSSIALLTVTIALW